ACRLGRPERRPRGRTTAAGRCWGGCEREGRSRLRTSQEGSTARCHGLELLCQPGHQHVRQREEPGVVASHEVVVLALDPVEALGALCLAEQRERVIERMQLVLFAVSDEEGP